MSVPRCIHPGLIWVLISWTVSGVFGWTPRLVASDAATDHGQRELALAELPEPPPEFQDLLARGEVTFLIGGEQPSLVEQDSTASAQRRVFDAETRYRMSYTFKSHCRWGGAGTLPTQRLTIQIRYEQLQLQVEHRVWLREMPAVDTFWGSPLVRHELDHIRVSSDPRLNARFIAAVKQHDKFELTPEEIRSLRATAASRQRAGAARDQPFLSSLVADDAQRWVDERVRAQFDRIVELVEIRYRELDLQTDHGRTPVPDASVLHEWLTPSD